MSEWSKEAEKTAEKYHISKEFVERHFRLFDTFGIRKNGVHLLFFEKNGKINVKEE